MEYVGLDAIQRTMSAGALRNLVWALPMALVCLVLGAAFAKGFGSPPAPAAEGPRKDVQRLTAQVSALERRIGALEMGWEPVAAPPPASPVREPVSAAVVAVPPAAGEALLRDVVRQVIDEKEKVADQQREERRKEWEAQRTGFLAAELGLPESLKPQFAEILLDYQNKVRQLYRDSPAPETLAQEAQRLRSERDLRLSAFLTPEQIRKLNERNAPRGPRP